MRKMHNRRLGRTRRHRLAERGVALVMVMIFLALMLLLGLATTMTSITEVNVGSNYRLSTEVFDVADAGASHGFELVRNMQGDFTHLLKGMDGQLKSGDEFDNPVNGRIRTYDLSGTIVKDDLGANFKADVKPIPRTLGNDNYGRALHKIDARHFYELIVYDNANDDKSWLVYNPNEELLDPVNPGTPAVDCDRRVLIRSIGYIMGEDTTEANFLPEKAIASAVVDIVVGLTPYPAIITNNDLTVQNGVEIRGSLGGVHANDNLTLGSGSFVIEQSATFSNDDGSDTDAGSNSTSDNTHVDGFNGPAGHLYIPDLNVFDTSSESRYIRRQADYIMITAGARLPERQALVNAMGGNALAILGPYMIDGVTAPGTAVTIRTTTRGDSPVYELIDTETSGNFSLDETPALGRIIVTTNCSNNSVSVDDIPPGPAIGTAWQRGLGLFVLMPEGEPNQAVSMNAGTDGQISILTNGSVLLNGNAKLRPGVQFATPYAPPWNQIQLLCLAGEDLKMNGTAGAGDVLEGVMYCHEQFDLSGSGYITGQVVGYDRDLIFSGGTYISNPSASVLTNPTPGSSVVTSDSIVHGNFEVNHSAANGYIGNFAQAAWRQLRDFDPVGNARPPL